MHLFEIPGIVLRSERIIERYNSLMSSNQKIEPQYPSAPPAFLASNTAPTLEP